MVRSVVSKAMWFGRTTAFMLMVAVTLALVFALVGLLVATKPTHASTTLIVNSTGDANDSDFPSGIFDGSSDGNCDTGSALVGPQGEIIPECTLRAAIQEASNPGGADTINFNILYIESNDCDATTKVCTISPASDLPTIFNLVNIDGYTQRPCSANAAPCSSPNKLAKGTNAALLIELSGVGLDYSSGEGVIRGLVINGAVGHAINSSGARIHVQGNFIGTDPSGTQDLGNSGSGVRLGLLAGGSTIGGTSPAARNLISGNSGAGVNLQLNDPQMGAVVQGNLIGTQRDGISPLGNDGSGVYIVDPDMGNTIGGTIPAAANTIAFNGGDGVTVVHGDSDTHRILSNSIFSNTGLGIDLADDGVTANDPGTPPDADTGPNKLQNYPEITSAKPAVKNGKKVTIIKGVLISTPSQTFTVQLFSNPLSDPNEGKTFIRQLTSVQTNADGVASFRTTVRRKAAPVLSAVTATATNNSTGDTSEFSAPKSVG